MQVWPHAGSDGIGLLVGVADAVVGLVVDAAMAEEQYLLSNAITVLATTVPHAALEQSIIL